jgi:hypothetical protein
MAEVEYYQGALTGQEIDALPNRLGNLNLLINGYFPIPVNQRGQTIYNASGSGWTIDGWYKRNAATVSLQSDGLHLTYPDDGALKGLNQRLPDAIARQLIGKTVTVSALVKDVNFPGATGYPRFGLYAANDKGYHTQPITLLNVACESAGLFSGTGVVPDFTTAFTTPYTGLNFAASYANLNPGSITVVAAKLELGESQTLAHLVNGEWQLNDIPGYAEELAKCQRYFQIFRTQSKRSTYGADFRPTMATDSPTLGTITIGGTTYYTASSEP